MEKYKKLFSRGRIGCLELRNRVVMSAMETSLSSFTGETSDRIIRFYEERAAGGTALIITEITRVAGGAGIGHPCQLDATSIGCISGLEKLADAVHRHGAKVFCQLHHPGREGKQMMTGEQIVGPSAIPSKANMEVPRALETAEVSALVQQFAMAAKLCQMAGIDGVELHGAHGYLIQQFMCEYSNQREDKYGGTFEKRMQFPTEIINSIKMVCGENFPVIMRINGDDYFEGGLTLEESVKIARHLEKVGIDGLNISAGGYAAPNESTEPISYPQGWKRHLARRIREEVSIPVIACDVIRKPEFAEQLLQEDQLDFVALGRAHLADPEWCRKSMEGREREIRPCISCMHCVEQVGAAKCIKCAVNPRTSYELVYGEMKPDGAGRTAVVVGGGPAGMEAAIALAERAFRVVLFEKEEQLGGDVRLAAAPPNKEKLLWLIDHMEYEMSRLGVEVLHEEATVDRVKGLDPWAVFMACGGTPILPDLPGITRENVYSVEEILNQSVRLEGRQVIVVGSGLTGLETAEYLAEAGNKVTVIEKEYRIAPGAAGGIGTEESPNVADVLKHLREKDVEVKILTELKGVREGEIEVDSAEGETSMKADAVVLALGVRPDRKSVEQFTENFQRVYVLGDARRQGRIADAVRSAFETVYYLR